MTFHVVILLAVLLISNPVSAGERPSLGVTYVANEGFLIECRDNKVAVDVFFGGWDSDEYYMPSDSMIELMTKAQPPFDSIDVIAVTHFHSDHFDADIVASHLKHDPRAVLICPPQVAERMSKVVGYADISNRIQSITAAGDSVVTFNVNGVDIKAIPGKHGSYYETDEATGETIDRHRDVQHLEYVISMYGRTVYHSGDAALDDMRTYGRLGFGNDVIDIALVQWFTPHEMISFREQLVREAIGGDKIIMMHLRPGRDLSGPEQRRLCAERNLIVPRTRMETWIVP